MPAHPFKQFSELEDTMSKHLLSLDLGEQNHPALPLNMAKSSPGYVGELCRSASFSVSSLPPDFSEGPFPTSSLWGQPSDSPVPSQPAASSNQWGKFGFLSQRSVSLVETRSMPEASLNWSSTELHTSKSEFSPTPLQAAASSSSGSSSRYKTELCRSFTENGQCKYGGRCQFAHGPEELRDLNRHPKYKTEPCRTFHSIGFCPYGIRCHFIHNSEEEKKPTFSRSSLSVSSSLNIPHQPAGSSSATLRPNRPPLVRQSFSFAGFPSSPQYVLQSVLTDATPPSAAGSFTCSSSGSPTSCADITDLLSSAFLELGSAFEASGAPMREPSAAQVGQADLRSPFLPSPDSGYSPSGLSPTSSPSLRQSPGATDVFLGSLGTRSLSYTSLSDQDQDGGSSASSLSGFESCGGSKDGNGKRLAVFSQLSVP
ncbi:PREDICTED: zinc finger protein 36, C3H1 type-like 1 [Cyprinodon variegatus]|uniref:mRNA decay activator protein ZFP36 n=1 Tax=Cyprinodon variegatus TaxID=28743 RepID=A0A3Q2DAC4_CYPVA|nr:PREDICTED: zinc finger protein 36, C3H1 type-like 1 [Cyprinodon variegatus]